MRLRRVLARSTLPLHLTRVLGTGPSANAARLLGIVLLVAGGAAAAQPNSTPKSPPKSPPKQAAQLSKPAPPAAAAPPEAPAGAADPIVLSVDGRPVRLSELGSIVQTLPPHLRDVPYDKLYPDVQERLVDHLALVMMAHRVGLENRPDVQRDILAATDRILEGAYLAQFAVPLVTEDAIRQRYDLLYAGKPATEEVHARHILVATEQEAKAIIEQLRKGADFTTLARVASKDGDGEKGGDLGFIRRTDVWPGLADVAFGLAPGQLAPDPVKNEFGWHVIQVDERRLVPPPTYAAIHDQIRQDLLAEAVRLAIQRARDQVIIHRYNVDGTEIPPTKRADDAAAALMPR